MAEKAEKRKETGSYILSFIQKKTDLNINI